MLIKCLNCSHENQLGSIFCRNCGQKLDIEAVRPELIDEKKTGIFKLLRKFLTIIILLATLGILAGFFVPYGFKAYEPLSEESQAKAKDKYDELVFRLDGVGRKKEFAFSLPEASYIFNNVMVNKASGDGSSNIVFDSDGKDVLTIVSESKIYDKIPMRMELTGKIVENPDAEAGNLEKYSFSFEVTSVKFGHVPLPSFLTAKIADKFRPLLETEALAKILKACATLQISPEGEFLLLLKKIPPPSKKTDK